MPRSKIKDFYKPFLSEPSWLIKEEGWQKAQQQAQESRFTLGNGYLGCRGVLEEIPYDSTPGFYLSGVYEEGISQVAELVNLPYPFNFKIVVEGEKIDVSAMDVLFHERILDLRKGFLKRRAIFTNARREKFDYQSLRFFSMHNPHLGVIQVCFTPLDRNIEAVVETVFDTSVENKGILSEGRKRHFLTTEVEFKNNINYLSVETLQKKITVSYAGIFKIDHERSYLASGNILKVKIKRFQTVIFTKFFSVYTCRDSSSLKRQTKKAVRRAFEVGFNNLLKRHILAWQKKWLEADIYIRDDSELRRTLRFNIYHLLISANPFTSRASIPARFLTGEGYRGHIFWDTEIFILPFFLYTFPKIARNILIYRYWTLPAARKNAEARGFKGALFAWESADTGEDVTPSWHKDLNGRIIKVKTKELEQHISADVAYGVRHYYLVTQDENFLKNWGLEIIFETARFWAWRVFYDKRDNLYHIRKVIGPDEFHENVDDNVYTNFLASQNLKWGVEFYEKYIKDEPAWFKKLCQKINLTAEEVEKWRAISEKIVILKKGRLFEQFKGYFGKKDAKILGLEKNFMPFVSRKIRERGFRNTQFIKQADVVMLFYLFWEKFSLKEKKLNFSYYERRTLHNSSLSPPIHAIVGWRLRNLVKSYSYFLFSLYTDLADLHRNTKDGIHGACAGGVWGFISSGVLGLSINREGFLCFNPKLPSGWGRLIMNIKYRGWSLNINLSPSYLKIKPYKKGKDNSFIIVNKEIFKLKNKKSIKKLISLN